MAAIKYICISDVHAGAATSLATHVDPETLEVSPTELTEVSVFVCRLLSGLSNKTSLKGGPQLILLGDMLDIAFSGRGDASNCFTTLLSELTDPGSTTKPLIIIPGNHDHAIWTGSRDEHQYANAAKNSHLPDLEPATPLTSSKFGSNLFYQIMKLSNWRSTPKPAVYYPNFALRSADGKRGLAFHHGHFVESTYRVMSSLYDALNGRPRTDISSKDLAAENANWIDFGWSTFGDAAGVGKDVTSLYEYVLSGSEGQKLRNRAIKFLDEKLTPSLPMGGNEQIDKFAHAMLAGIVDATIGGYSDTARFSMTEILPASSIEGLKWYIGGPLRKQWHDEFGDIPEDLTFIFGHTHKPFVDEIVVDELKNPVPVCNAGGWMLDAPRLDGREGASVALIDDDLNVVSVRLFDTLGAMQSVEPGAHRKGIDIAVDEAVLVSKPSESGKKFLEDVQKLLADPETVQTRKRLQELAATAYNVRQDYIFKHLEKTDREAAKSGAIL